MIPGDDMTDELWPQVADNIGDGWKAGRVHCGGGDIGEAFGWTKGPFGIFEACGDTEIGRLELCSLTHLKSGLRLALFASTAAATTAALLAERVGNWSEINERGLITDEWKARSKQMYELWLKAGLVYGPLTTRGKGIWCSPEPVEKQN